MWALAFIEIRPAGSPASLGAPLSTQPGLPGTSGFLELGQAARACPGFYFFRSLPQDLLFLPSSFPKVGPGSGAGHLQVSPSGGASGGAEPFLSGPASSASSWVIFPLLS